MDNYPDWTSDGDPRAPWNHTEPEDVYGEAAEKRISDEMSERGGDFDEWLNENGYLPDEDDVEDSTYEQICELLAADNTVYEKYHEHRYYDLIEDLQEEAADRYEYERCEAEERL